HIQRAVARNASRSVILLRSTNMIGHIDRRGDVIELPRRIALHRPGFSAICRNGAAAIVAADHARRVIRSDPQIMMIGMWRAKLLKGSTSVIGPVKLHVERVDRFAP